MPVELTNLNERLLNLQVVFQSAVAANEPLEYLTILRIMIIETQDKIIEHEKFIAQQNSPSISSVQTK
jgi:hypothetical protein